MTDCVNEGGTTTSTQLYHVVWVHISQQAKYIEPVLGGSSHQSAVRAARMTVCLHAWCSGLRSCELSTPSVTLFDRQLCSYSCSWPHPRLSMRPSSSTFSSSRFRASRGSWYVCV